MTPHPKKLEIFCGTGGVGKTTLSTSRAVFLAQQGRKVLLMTIDPSQRLKDVLLLDDKKAGQVQHVPQDLLEEEKRDQTRPFTLDALLISPMKTLQRTIYEHQGERDLDNRILNILFNPNGGMNEIMGLLEVHYYINSGQYDTIILDTPPGKHFIEFLESCQRIQNFFDQSFIEIFQFLPFRESKEGNGDSKKSKGKLLRPISAVFKKFIGSGVKKLLDYLEKFTGGTFVEEFVTAVEIIYKLKTPFLKTLDFQKNLKDPHFSNWFLVTSIEQDKIEAALGLKESAELFLHKDSFMTINKCLEKYWEDWEKDKEQRSSSFDVHLKNLKTSLVERERKLKDFAKSNFMNVMEFQEVFSSSALVQVRELVEQWKVNS